MGLPDIVQTGTRLRIGSCLVTVAHLRSVYEIVLESGYCSASSEAALAYVLPASFNGNSTAGF